MNRLKRAFRSVDVDDFVEGLAVGLVLICIGGGLGALLWFEPVIVLYVIEVFVASAAIGLIYAAIKGARRGE